MRKPAFRWKVPSTRYWRAGAIVGLANHTVLLRRDGSELPIDDSGAPIRESDGTVRGVVLIFRDFTAHKEFERTLIRAKEADRGLEQGQGQVSRRAFARTANPAYSGPGHSLVVGGDQRTAGHASFGSSASASQRRTRGTAHRRPPRSDQDRKREAFPRKRVGRRSQPCCFRCRPLPRGSSGERAATSLSARRAEIRGWKQIQPDFSRFF